MEIVNLMIISSEMILDRLNGEGCFRLTKKLILIIIYANICFGLIEVNSCHLSVLPKKQMKDYG